MALGKAAKYKRNLARKIQHKLDAKILTDDFYNQFRQIIDTKTDSYFDKEKQIEMDNKFKMYVYNYELLGGKELTKAGWIEWIDYKRKNK